jgi:hypothetical protein
MNRPHRFTNRLPFGSGGIAAGVLVLVVAGVALAGPGGLIPLGSSPTSTREPVSTIGVDDAPTTAETPGTAGATAEPFEDAAAASPGGAPSTGPEGSSSPGQDSSAQPEDVVELGDDHGGAIDADHDTGAAPAARTPEPGDDDSASPSPELSDDDSASPSPEPGDDDSASPETAEPQETAEPSAEPSESPEPEETAEPSRSPSAEPSTSPEPGDDNSGGGRG